MTHNFHCLNAALWIMVGGVPTTAIDAQTPPGAAALTNITRLTTDAVNDNGPALAFASSGPVGLLAWSKRVGTGTVSNAWSHQYHSVWNGASWGAATFVPRQTASPARHFRQCVSFRPGTTEATNIYDGSAIAVASDSPFARQWRAASGWDLGPTLLGDTGVVDDDQSGSVRWDRNGRYALAVWRDHFGVNDNRSSIAGRIYDPGTAAWAPATVIHAPGAAPLVGNRLNPQRCLEQNPVSGAWVVAFKKDGGPYSPRPGEISYRMGTASVTGMSFGPEITLTMDTLDDLPPQVSFKQNGGGAIFWTREDAAGDGSLACSLFDGVAAFGSPFQLTDHAGDKALECVIPVGDAWHVIWSATPRGENDRELYWAWFDGTSLGTVSRLTHNAVDDSSLHGAVDSSGTIHVAWSQCSGSGALCREVHVARLELDFYRQISKTLNIYWQAVSGTVTQCEGIEFTDGTIADTADGSFTMSGISSTPACVGTAGYSFSVSPDGLTLTGLETTSNTPMTLTRGQGEACFIGTWTSMTGPQVYRAHIAADAFFCQPDTPHLDILWSVVSGPLSPCETIESTNGELADAEDGIVTMSGTSLSAPECFGLGRYRFAVSPDGLTLAGRELVSNDAMTLTRSPGAPCFVGDRTIGPNVYRAHVLAEPFFCHQIAGTLNIYWKALASATAPCESIEYTDGTYADAADGTVTMSGTGTSNPSCTGAAAYTFTVTPDLLTLNGFETVSNTPMTLSRRPGEPCFVGDWRQGQRLYRAYIAAEPFLCGNSSITAIPTCPAGHHALGGPMIAIANSATTADVTVTGSNLAGTALCGLLIGTTSLPIPLSLIGSTTPGAALCINPFATIRCGAAGSTTRFVFPVATDPGLCGAAFDVQYVDWLGIGADMGSSAAMRIEIGG